MKVMQALFLTAALTAAAVSGGCKESASDRAFGARVRSYLLAHPEVLEETVAALDAKKAADARAGRAAGLDKHRAALERNPMDYVANPKGKITVVEFFDYRCGYCKTIAPAMVKLIAENPDVRFVFKDFPIFGGESDMAAALALAARDSNKYLTLYSEFFAAQDLAAEDIERIVTSAGLDYSALREKAVQPAVVKHLQDTKQLARDLKFEGTPHFVVGDTVVEGANLPALKAAIAAARKAA